MFLQNMGNLGSVRSVGGRLTLKKLDRWQQADADAINITLFRNIHREACGWFIGPLGFHDGRFVLPFLPKSAETRASLAVVRALEAAEASGRPLCLIDPENLWDSVWGS